MTIRAFTRSLNQLTTSAEAATVALKGTNTAVAPVADLVGTGTPTALTGKSTPALVNVDLMGKYDTRNTLSSAADRLKGAEDHLAKLIEEFGADSQQAKNYQNIIEIFRQMADAADDTESEKVVKAAERRVAEAKARLEAVYEEFGPDSKQVEDLRRYLEQLELNLAKAKELAAEAKAETEEVAEPTSPETHRLVTRMRGIAKQLQDGAEELRMRGSAAAAEVERVIQEVDRTIESSERTLTTALDRLRQAAEPFGNTNASSTTDESGNRSGGGFVTSAYALDLVKQYAAIIEELNSKSEKAIFYGPQLRQGLMQLESFFRQFFPQFGDLTKLAKEFMDEMESGTRRATDALEGVKKTSTRGSSSNRSRFGIGSTTSATPARAAKDESLNSLASKGMI